MDEVCKLKYAKTKYWFWRYAFHIWLLATTTALALDSGARGITVAKNTPYNCKILGESEGKDDAEGKSPPSPQKLREGAVNDLRNEAVHVVGEGKRAMLAITRERVICATRKGGTYNCTHQEKIPAGNYPISHKITAQVFDCGEK